VCGEDEKWSFQTQLDRAETLEFDMHGGAQWKEGKKRTDGDNCRQWHESGRQQTHGDANIEQWFVDI